MLRRLFFLLPLLLITEGHMSDTVRSLTLEQVVRRSDAVLRVEKADPAVATRTVQAGKKKGQTFDFTLYRFRVKEVLHSRLEGVKVPESLEVEAAANAKNFAQEENFFAGKPTRILIYETYRSEDPRVDSLPECLIFVRYDGARKRFVFVAQDAREGVEKESRIRSLLDQVPAPDP